MFVCFLCCNLLQLYFREELKSEPESDNERQEDVARSFMELQMEANLRTEKDSNFVFAESIFDENCEADCELNTSQNTAPPENDNLLNYFFDEFDTEQTSRDSTGSKLCSESEAESKKDNKEIPNKSSSGSEISCLDDHEPAPEKKSKTMKSKSKENGPKILKCKFCENNFTTKKKFKTHDCPSRQSIMENNKFICNVCGKELLRDSYTYHMSTHSANRKLSFNCDHENCTKSFYTKQHLTQHKKSHSGEFKYNCDVCDKRFVQKHHRDRHLSIHTGNLNQIHN